MKKLRSTLFLLILTVFGGAYLWWNERAPAPREGAVILLRAPQNEVKRVVLLPAKLVFEAQSTGDFLVRDLKTGRVARLDDEAARPFWSQIALVQSNLAVENPEKAAQYGLKTPRASIEVDGRKLEFGAPAPFDKTRIYARGANQIALVSADLAKPASQPFEKWRDRSVLRNIQSASAFSLRSGSGEVRFSKSDAGWQLSAPRAGIERVAADKNAVEAALNSLESARISRWLDENGKNAARFGLEPPQIAFRAGDARFEIGQKTANGYAARMVTASSAKFGITTPIVEVPASLFAVLGRPTRAWRDFRVAKFDLESIARLELAVGKKTRILVREGNDWRLQTGTIDPKITAAALDLLDFAQKLRATDFVEGAAPDAPRFGLKTPVLALKGQQSDETMAFELRFGRVQTKLWGRNLTGSSSPSPFALEKDALDATSAARTKIFAPTN